MNAVQAQKSSLGGREVFGSDFAREVCLVRLPVPRVRMSCRPCCDKFCKADATTSDCVYQSVAMADTDGLPRISREQKAKVLDLTSAAPPSWTGSAVPLFWTESGLLHLVKPLNPKLSTLNP